MNHIYKVVWSKVRGCYVVVAEIARSNGKTRSQKVVAVLGTALISSMLFTGGGLLTAEAASQTIGGYIFDDTAVSIATSGSTVSKTSGSNTIALGSKTTATGANAVALGEQNKATGDNAIAFGGGYGKDAKSNTASGTASVAFGEGSWAVSEGSVAFGYGTQAGNTITDKNGKYTGQNAVAFGNGTKALGGRSLAFGENTTANYNDSVAFGNGATAFSSGATAFGNRSRALSQYATSFGDNTVAAGSMSFAFGTDTIAGALLDDNGALELTDGSRMDSYGNKAYTTTDAEGKTTTYSIKGMRITSGDDVHDYVVVTGTKADDTTGTYVEDYQGGIAEVKVNDDGTVTKIKDLYSGKYGGWYQYDDNGNVVMGTNGKPAVVSSDTLKKQNKSIPVTLDKATPGNNGYTLIDFKNATAFGYSTEASGVNATAFGNDTKAKAAAATSFGTTTTAFGNNATAFGLSTTASGKQATAFGSSSTASGDNATAFGESSTASGEAATAFGISSNASGKNSLAALGGTASNENSIAIGKDTKANNADKAVSVAIGQNAEASGAQSLAIGFGNVSETNQSGNTKYPVSATQATAKGAIAIGINTGAKGEHSVAMGSYTDAAKDSSVAIGFDTHTLSDSAVAIGSGTKAAGRYSVALGLSSIAGTETNDAKNPLDGGGSVAMGYAASSEASRSIAIGTGATAADSQFTTAVGDSTIARAEGSVAIGAGSVATRGAGNKESTVSTDLNTGKTTITYGDEKKAYLKPDNLSTDKANTWVSTTGAVSVGGQATYKEYDDTGKLVKKTKLLTRQITNVAAGSDDTDAVNVAQLKAAQPTVTSNDHSVTINPTTDSTDYHKNYDLKIATATLSKEMTTGDKPVENGKIAVKNPTYTGSDGNPVTNENAYVTGKSVADAINDSGFNLIASKSEGDVTGNANALIHPGDTVTIDAGKNISLTQDKGKISIATKDNLNLGSADSKDDKQQVVPGTDGSITVNGKNGSAVAINGQDGSIGLTGPKGTDGKSTSIQMSTIMSTSTLDDSKNIKTTTGEGGQQTTTTQAPRIQYKNGNTTYEVATMYDGQTYAGDVQDSNAKANAFSRKLNEQTNVVGGVTNLDDLSKANNVGVVSNGTDTLTIRLAKKLTDLTSVTTVTTDAKGNKTSETVQNGNGITITPSTLGAGKSDVSLTDKGLSNGGNQITHVDSGLKDAKGNPVDLATASGDVLNNAVNVGDLKNVASAHTAVTVNGENEAPDAGANGNLGKYTDKEKGNLLLAQKKDKNGKITYDLKLNDNVILGKDTSDGKDGQEGTIGLTGKDGVPGTDGKQGYSTTIIKTEKGQKGADGKTGKENLGGTDITRIVYTDKDGNNPQTVATLSDGLKFAGDDMSKTVDKKLNETLQIRGDGTYDKEKNTVADDGNIKTSVDNGAVKVSLSDKINLHQDGYLTVGGSKNGNAADGNDPIVIKHFDDKTLDVITGVDKEGKPIIAKVNKAGDYVTGLDNKDWNVDKPEYVSGRAATEDQLKTISDTIKSNAETAAGQHTAVTVNDKDNETTAPVGTDGKYSSNYGSYSDSSKGNLLIAAKTKDGQTTYNIKLNDQLAIGQKGEQGVAGKDGQDGKVTVETSKGTTVVIGHDGEPGKDGKDCISVKGQDGKDGVTISVTNGKDGKDGSEGHIGLTGPAGKDGKNASADIHVKNGQNGVDGTDGNNGTNGMDRIVYEDHNGKDHEVATMDDGQKYGGDNYVAATDKAAEQNVITKKLNERLDIKGGAAKDKLTEKNIGVNVENGVMKVQLAQNLDLDDNGSVKMGNTTIKNGGVTITPTGVTEEKDKISLTDKGLSNGGKQITHIDSGLKDAAGNKVELKDATGDVLNNAVNVGDLKNVQNAVTSAHTAVTVNGSVEAPDAGANGTLGSYTDEKKGNLLLAQKKDSTGKITYDLKLNDKVVLGKAGKDGIDGSIGLTGADGKSSIGLNGKDGISVIGKDGQNGVSITGSNGLNGENGIDGKIAIGTPGKDGQPGKDAVSISGKDGVGHIGLTGPKGADGKDGAFTDLSTILGTATLDRNQNEVKDKDSTKDKASRIQYQTTVKEADGTTKTITHEVATMDDGLKFAGDDVNTTVAKKLNSTLQIRGDGTYDKDKNTVADDGNIKTSVDNGAVKVSLSDKINLHQDGYLTVGGSKNGNAADGNDPIVIKHFDDKTLDVITGVDKEGKPIIAKEGKAGDYVTGLDNKNWNVDKPEYVSGRAATEDQLKTISDAVKEAATTAGKHIVVTVENGKAAGTTDYNGENLKLKVTEKDGQKTYDLKLNDKVTLGKDGVDGSIGLKGADGKSSIGLNGKDGISVIGKDGQNGVSITGSNGLNGENGIDGKIAIGTPGKDGQPGKDAVSISGQKGEGHIGLTGPAGKDGKDASADIHVKNGQVGVDGTDGHGGKDGMDRVVYEDHNHITHEVATMDDGMKYAGDFGKGASVKLNKTVKVKGNAKKEADLTDGNIGVVSSQSGDNGQLLIKLNKDLNLGNNGSVKMGNTTINNDGMTISKTESGKTTTVTLTDKGLNNGGNKITNVAAGTDGTDAVNVSQLNDVKHLAEQHTTVEAGPSGNVKVTSGTNADGSKKYTVDLAKDVTFGNAGNGDKTVAISGTDGTVTAGTGDNKVTVDGSKGQIVAGGDNGVKIGNIANGDSSLTIYDKDGNATKGTDKAGKYVTNLDNKTWNTDGSYVSGRAATEDQLHQVESNVNTKIDNVDKHHTEVTVNGGTTAKADGSYTDGNLQIAQKTGADGQKVYDLKLNDTLNIGGVGKDGKDGHVGINGKDGKSGVGIDGKDGISIKGKDGQNGVTIKGVDGKDGTEGHIGLVGPKGPKGADGKDGQNASADIHVKNGQVGVDGTDGHGGKDGMDRVVYEDHNGTSHEVATMDDGMKYSGDSGSAAVKLNNNVQLYGGAKEYAAGDNIGVVVSQDGDNAKMQVKLAKDLKGIDSIDAKTVTTGNTTINNGGLTVKGDDKHKDITVQQGSVNMGGNKIEGVAPGKVAPDSTEAINGSQLAQRDQAIGKLGGEVSSLDRRVDRVGAGAAALAALHPQDFDPDDKWDFAVGYGNYRGANAAAVGAFYRPNEDTTLSVGGTVGGGENMVNAGISFKFGQGNHVTNSRVAMAKELLALKDYVQKQDEKIEQLEALVGKQGTAAAPKRRSILFPDVPENHWAYAYVKKLADRGLLEGYPDGEFKGDRTITRYEFAAIFSRALENGASVDTNMERMSEEFEPEIRELSLNRFRVDRVEGKDNDRHKIERVRVNDRDELVKQKNGEQKKRYRDVYGSVIEKDAPADAAK